MPWPRGGIPDRLALRGADPARDEALELPALGVEHAHGGVARAGELARHPQELLEHGVDLELRHEAAAGLEQRRQPSGVQRP